MKRLFAFVIAAVLTVGVLGCGSRVSKKEVSQYLEGAKAENAVNDSLLFYEYDGQTTTVKSLSDPKKAQEIVDSLSKVKALPVADWLPSVNSAPVYGISIPGNAEHLWIVGENGMALIGTEKSYEFEYDFKALANKYVWDKTDYLGGYALPGKLMVSRDENGWVKNALSEATNDNIADSLKVKITDASPEKLTFTITNQMGMDWVYDAAQSYRLEVRIDGNWYHVPLNNVTDIAGLEKTLAMGDSMTGTYELKAYGELPIGRYRLIVYGPDAEGTDEFLVTGSGYIHH